MFRKKVIKFLIIAVIMYVALIAILYVKQRSFIYFPDNVPPANSYGAEIVQIVTDDGLTLKSWYFAPRDPAKPVILYYHGNGGNYGYLIFKSLPFTELGYGALLSEYRGYGGNAGSPSEEWFYKDGRKYIEWLKGKGVEENNIVLYGGSIGSGTATQMATEIKAKALILEAPFSSLVDVAARVYFFAPVHWLVKDRFMNIDKIDKINMPLLVMHGHQDSTIPFSLAKKLFYAASQPKTFVEFEQGDHNNLYNLGAAQKVLEFLEQLDHKAKD